MIITLYIACNTFICAILFGLLESQKIALFKYLTRKIIEAKIAKIALFRNFELDYLQDKTVKKGDSDRPNRIVQMNALNAIYSNIVI